MTLSLLDPRNPLWRRKLRTASFKGAPFFVDQQGQSSGRRTVLHEYPKRDLPYAEDMGRAAYRYQMTGYLIQYPMSDNGKRPNGMWCDYSLNRDYLRRKLDSIGPGVLVDPYNPDLSHLPDYLNGVLTFMCERYTCQESRERGGYAAFEMTFVEAGAVANVQQKVDSASQVQTVADAALTAGAGNLNSFLAAVSLGDTRLIAATGFGLYSPSGFTPVGSQKGVTSHARQVQRLRS